MPVSTFSHGSTTIRAGARSEIVSRWNSTRERILLDDQRVKDQQIQELDGTGLYERSDWPMRPVSVSPPAESGGNAFDAADAVVDLAVEGSHHITDVATCEPEVQWVVVADDDDVDETPQTWASHRASGNGTWPRGRAALLPVREDEEASHEPVRVRKGRDSGTSVSPSPNAEEVFATSVRQRQMQEAKVTNIDSQTSGLYADGPRSSSRSSARHVAITIEPPQDYDITIPTAERSQPTPSPTGSVQITPDYSRRTSPVAEEANGTSTVKARKSSIAKPPLTEEASQLSSLHNLYNTTQITQNRDCVRYSWQSAQDDEPNRPRINIIKLVSNTATSSAGFPQGEAFGFSVSAGGRRVAAYNSARLYILQTLPLPVGISQDFALKRRPLAVEILDDGTFLAILSDQHTVNVWDLSQQSLQRSRTIKLDFPTYCIALAPTGGLLAVAYDGGVEIFSLDPNALPTDRRAVRSQKMDRLSFSQDGSTLLGSTTRINASSSVVVNVPVFPAAPNGVPTSEELKEAWCSELLHPENIRNSSHATFMRENRDSCTDRLFAWNGIADTFGILNTTNLQYGHVDFPVVISPPLSTCGGLGAAIHSVPAIDEYGDTVAMIINDRTIRLYIVPHKAADGDVSVEAHSIDHELDAGYGCPFSDARWVHSDTNASNLENNQTHVQGRLIVTSPGSVGDSGMPEESVQDVEGGRIIIFDFDSQFAGQPGQTFSLTLGNSPPQVLEEPEIDVAVEVALIRRRTVNQNRGGGLSQRAVSLGRAATTSNPSRNGVRIAGPDSAPRRANSVVSAYPVQPDALPDLAEANEANMPHAAIDEPFLNTVPRSQASLQRAASNAQRHRFQALEERVHDRLGVENAAAFLPLPEYTEEPNAPLPSRFRAMAGLDTHAPAAVKPSVTTNSNAGRAGLPSGPASAPVSAADGFSSQEAYIAAVSAQTPTGNNIGDIAPRQMPRSLQRAYSNVVGPVGVGPAPQLVGDWMNVSPVGGHNPRSFPSSSNGNAAQQSAVSPTTNEEMWDSISPDTPRNNQYRYSTSLLNPPGHQVNQPLGSHPTNYARSATSILPPHINFATNRRVPPHIQAFRDAAAASSNTASLFSSAQPSDHVPYRQIEPVSTVPHPVTAWHPPRPSSPAPAPSVPRGNVRSPTGGHSRRTSQNIILKTAFPPTEKAKKLGFFKRKRKGGERDSGLYEGTKLQKENKSDVQWMAGKKKKEGSGCVVM
ncbi:hypothetical protein Q7P35_006422 [Cladosporium inversicolor]